MCLIIIFLPAWVSFGYLVSDINMNVEKALMEKFIFSLLIRLSTSKSLIAHCQPQNLFDLFDLDCRYLGKGTPHSVEITEKELTQSSSLIDRLGISAGS